MFRSLRWRLVGAFGLVILLTVLLSGLLSIWATANRFDILITDEGREWAEQIAPLLEANYAYWGDWGGLDELLSDEFLEAMPPPELFETPWVSDVDWWSIVVDVLDADNDVLTNLWDEHGSLAKAAQALGVEPGALVEAIVEAEQQAIDQALFFEELSPDQAAEEMAWVDEAARSFVWQEESIEYEWDAIIARELGLELEDLTSDSGVSGAELAWQRQVYPEQLLETILDIERQALEQATIAKELTPEQADERLAWAEENIWLALWQNAFNWESLAPEWGEIAARELDVSLDDLYAGGVIAEVAELQRVNPDRLVDAILTTEMQAIQAAIDEHRLTPEQADSQLAWLSGAARVFVFENISSPTELEWDAIIANELDVPLDALYEFMDAGGTIVELAQECGIEPEQLVEAVLAVEERALLQDGMFSEQDIQWYLIKTANSLWALIDPEADYGFYLSDYGDEPAWTAEGAAWVIDSLLLGDRRLLIANVDGLVIYDSAGERQKERLSQATLNQGTVLWHQEIKVGTALVAAGPGYYNAHQSAFLQGVTRSLAVSGLLAGLGALLIGLIVARQVTAPVTALTQATRHLADGDWAARLPVRSNDELGQMNAAFNTMAQELQAQRLLRNRLVDDIAHELSTPLSIIQLELEALKDCMQTPEQAATHVQREIHFLRNLVDDLALLSESEAGALQLALKPTDLAQLSAQAVARWQAQAETAGAELCYALRDAKTLPPVLADRRRLAQVLGNLLDNALQHTAPGGRVEVRCFQADKSSPSDSTSQAYLWTTISDSGEGIPPDDLPYVFERFYRADRSRSRRTGGRGLGLAIVRQIVLAHGGHVWVESEAGVGSTFGYSVPLKSDD